MEREQLIKRLTKIAFDIYPNRACPVIFIVAERNGQDIDIDWVRTRHEWDYSMDERDDRIYWKLDDWQFVPVRKIADKIMGKWGN